MGYADQSHHQKTQVNSVELLDGLLHVSQLVRLRLNEWLGDFDLNDGRLAVLAALSQAREDGYSQAELAEQLGQSASNISTLVERMARDGLVSRIQSNADRRKRVLSITSSGRLKLASVDTKRCAWATRLLNGVAVDDQPRLHSILKQIGSRLESTVEISTQKVPVRTQPLEVATLSAADDRSNPTEDPQSPQFALRQMLIALSSSSDIESNDEKDAA